MRFLNVLFKSYSWLCKVLSRKTVDDFISGVLSSDVLQSYFVHVADSISIRRNFLRYPRAFTNSHCAIYCWTNIKCKAILYNSEDVGSANCQLYTESVFSVTPASISGNSVYFKKGKQLLLCWFLPV